MGKKYPRIKTKYPGVFYRQVDRIGKPGTEKVYYVLFKRNGKLIEERIGRQYADKMTEAKAATARSDLIEGRRLTRKEERELEAARKKEKKWTIDRLSEAYFKNRSPGKSKSVDQSRYDKFLKSEFGKKQPKEIVKLDTDRIRRRLLKTKSPQTVKHVLNLLTWIINHGAKNSMVDPLPFKIQKPTVNNLRTEDLTPDQLANLMDAIDADENDQIQGFMKMALFTGMRRGELFKLEWTDIDFGRGFIHIRDPKGGTDQKIPLNRSAREVLKKHPRVKGSPFVFPGRGGKRRVSVQEASNRIKKRAGLPDDFRPVHGLRHAYASMLASSGKVDMYTLQKLLTHKSPQVTQRYAHLRDEALQQAANLAGDLIDDAVKKNKKATKLERKAK